MKIVAVLNFSRSGGTVLARILGMLPDVIVGSEINPLLGATTDNQPALPGRALRQQMETWYGISLVGENLPDAIIDLIQQCQRDHKQLIIRDWTHLDFRKNKLNKWNPTCQFTIIKELRSIAELLPFAFVRDSIDVYLSSGGNLEDFASDYLTYARELVKSRMTIVKYEDLVKQPDKTVKRICDITGLKYSEDYKSFYTNYRCTGDIQLGRVSRGVRQQSLSILPRKWVGARRRARINICRDLLEANRLLGYPESYSNGNVETFGQMIRRRIRNKFETFRRRFNRS